MDAHLASPAIVNQCTSIVSPKGGYALAVIASHCHCIRIGLPDASGMSAYAATQYVRQQEKCKTCSMLSLYVPWYLLPRSYPSCRPAAGLQSIIRANLIVANEQRKYNIEVAGVLCLSLVVWIALGLKIEQSSPPHCQMCLC